MRHFKPNKINTVEVRDHSLKCSHFLHSSLHHEKLKSLTNPCKSAKKKRTREIYTKYSYSSSCYFNNKSLQHNVFEKQLELKPREKHFVVDNDETCLTAQGLINSSLILMTSISWHSITTNHNSSKLITFKTI